MQLLYKFKYKILLSFLVIALSSCSVISEELSCKFSEIDCYRFNYTSVDSFNDSVLKYSEQWSLSDPTNALIKITPKEKLSISSSVEAENLILESPESIYALGIYIKNNQKPREWLFVAEQAYLRSWNSLGR
ncbi:hypothetical protein ABXT44_03390 [Candidatus Pseudothioglobus sp. Uisw_041]|uniref:hypothetical protein n=1 Tax=Candidatus Pseudothioglobus sp. Uisw_041 TaxID=3230996 RepID=UPI003A89C59A